MKYRAGTYTHAGKTYEVYSTGSMVVKTIAEDRFGERRWQRLPVDPKSVAAQMVRKMAEIKQ